MLIGTGVGALGVVGKNMVLKYGATKGLAYLGASVLAGGIALESGVSAIENNVSQENRGYVRPLVNIGAALAGLGIFKSESAQAYLAKSFQFMKNAIFKGSGQQGRWLNLSLMDKVYYELGAITYPDKIFSNVLAQFGTNEARGRAVVDHFGGGVTGFLKAMLNMRINKAAQNADTGLTPIQRYILLGGVITFGIQSSEESDKK